MKKREKLRLDLLEQGCTTQISWRAINIFLHFLRAKNCMFLLFQMVFLANLQGKRANKISCAGQIKSFRGPHLAHRPYLCMAVLEQCFPKTGFMVSGLKKFGKHFTREREREHLLKMPDQQEQQPRDLKKI